MTQSLPSGSQKTASNHLTTDNREKVDAASVLMQKLAGWLINYQIVPIQPIENGLHKPSVDGVKSRKDVVKSLPSNGGNKLLVVGRVTPSIQVDACPVTKPEAALFFAY